MQIEIKGRTFDRLLAMPKYELVRYARKVKQGLPHEEIFTSGTKVDIAYSIVGALHRNPR